MKALRTCISEPRAIEHLVNNDTALLGQLRSSLEPMPTLLLTFLMPCLLPYETPYKVNGEPANETEGKTGSPEGGDLLYREQ